MPPPSRAAGEAGGSREIKDAPHPKGGREKVERAGAEERERTRSVSPTVNPLHMDPPCLPNAGRPSSRGQPAAAQKSQGQTQRRARRRRL